MILFWFLLALLFFIVELATLTFGFVFITIGAIIITFLLGLDIISNSDILYQTLIMLFFGVVSFFFFYNTFKKSKENKNIGFKEDMNALVVEKNIVKGVEGKIKWSGTIFNAIIYEKSDISEIPLGTIVNIREFKGNVAIIDKL